MWDKLSLVIVKCRVCFSSQSWALLIWDPLNEMRNSFILVYELNTDCFGPKQGIRNAEKGRVQTTWTEFWAILTPFPLCRHFYLIAVIKRCDHLSNPPPPHLSTWFVHVPKRDFPLRHFQLYVKNWIFAIPGSPQILKFTQNSVYQASHRVVKLLQSCGILHV